MGTSTHHSANDQTHLSLEPLQCELFLHLVLDPGVCAILPLQQGGPAVTCFSISLHQNDPNQTIVLYSEKGVQNKWRMNYCSSWIYTEVCNLPSVHVASSDTVFSNNLPWENWKKIKLDFCLFTKLIWEGRSLDKSLHEFTLNISFPLTCNSMSLDAKRHLTSLADVPGGTLTSIKTSSIVWYQDPQGVLQGTTPLLSSKWTDILLFLTDWQLS